MAYTDQFGHKAPEVATSGVFELVLPRSNGWTNSFRDTAIEECGDYELTYTPDAWDGNIPWMFGADEVGGTITNWNNLREGFYILQRPGNYCNVYSVRNGGLVYEGINFGTANGAANGHEFKLRRTGTTLEWLIDGTVVRTETTTADCVNPAAVGYYSNFWNGTGNLNYESS